MATLTIVAIGAIGAAVRSQPVRAVAVADPSASLGVRTPVPAPVISTLRRACFDCHSDETRWPWYASVPVASHLIERDVTLGRAQLNLSHWTHYNPFARADMLDKMCELASGGRMPPRPYRMMHPQSRLSPTDVAALCAWGENEAARLVQGEK